MQRNKDFGGFVGQPLELIGDNLGAVLLYLAVVGGLGTVGLMTGLVDASDSLAGLGFGFSVDASDGLASALFELSAAVLTIVASYFLLAKLLDSRGRLADPSTRIWAYIGLSILAALGIVLGLLLFIVPGLMLLVRWSASSGFLVGGRRGITESLGASWDATRGYSWPIFFAALVLFIGLIVLAGVSGGIATSLGSDPLIALVSSVFEAAGNALSLVFGVGVYTLVNDDSEQIGEVFA